MTMRKLSPPHAPLGTTDTETAEDGAEWAEQTVRGRSACRLVAGAAGMLLVVAVVAAAASPPAERGAPGCRGPSCMAQSDHLDKVLELKQNTMELGDCPLGYYGTILNIKGKGKQWTFGNLTACSAVCDQREGCKGFEFHDKNGRCGTYTDGYILGGQQHYRWLTCVREGEKAVNAMFRINNLTFETLVANPEAEDALEGAVREVVAKYAKVPQYKVGVAMSPGSIILSNTIGEGGIDFDADQLAEMLGQAGPAILVELKEVLLAIPSVVALLTGELTLDGYKVRVYESWDPRTTTASEAPTTSEGER